MAEGTNPRAPVTVEIPTQLRQGRPRARSPEMSRAGGFKSKFSKGKKPEVESKREDGDKLYYRINRKSGRVETNFLEWERS